MKLTLILRPGDAEFETKADADAQAEEEAEAGDDEENYNGVCSVPRHSLCIRKLHPP